ncbi:MAG: OmpH family outer membrane protein [Oceanospirillaceae bacterium]
MRICSVLVLVAVVFFTGCGADNGGKVAVIDLDEIAAVLGRNNEIDEQVRQYTSEQELRLTALRDELRANIEKEEKALGKKPKKAKQQAFDQLSESSENQLRQEIVKVQQAAEQLRVNLVMGFKKEVEPVARRVGDKNGMGVIMIKQNFMLTVAPASDITNAVIDELQKIEPAKT